MVKKYKQHAKVILDKSDDLVVILAKLQNAQDHALYPVLSCPLNAWGHNQSQALAWQKGRKTKQNTTNKKNTDPKMLFIMFYLLVEQHDWENYNPITLFHQHDW